MLRITKLYRETEELLNGSKNVNEVSEKLLDIDEAFARFEKAHYDYIAALSGTLEEWESEARYFKEHCNQKMNFESRIEQWIHSVKVPVVTNEDVEIPPEDVVSTAHLSIRQLKAKQALAHLKLKQLKHRQELLRQEEETKLKLEVLEAQYEVQKTDLQVKLLQDEDIDYPNLQGAFNELNPFEKGVAAQAATVRKQEDPELGGRKKSTESRSSQSQLNPNAREFKGLPAGSSADSAESENEYISPEQFIDKMASTIRQGFALPKKELAIFDGDPLEYWNFIKSFETSIVSNVAGESEKLMYLLQYTSGVAKDTIKCCLYKDPSLGYQTARKLLEERFGHPFRIASQYVTKLTEGPPLKPSDRTGLLALADQLKDCEHTLESIGYLDEINSADNLRRIVQRLPFHLRTKFVEVADQIQEAGQRTNISHIAEFVKIKARAANNPVFGCVVDVARDRSDSQRRKPKPKRATLPEERGNAFSTQETNFREGQSSPGHKEAPAMRYAVCPACNAAHPLAKCKIFVEKNFDERLQVMRKAQLCHNCFRYGHIAVGCLARSACEVQGCKRRHHTLLHPPPSHQPVENRPGAAENGTQVSSSTPLPSGQINSTSAGRGKVCLRVVPVKVRTRDANKAVETYALLDSGSDISLCDKTLAMELGVRGQEKTFFLTTQEREDSPRVGHEISLTVEPVDGTDKVEVKRLWTVDRLNASKQSIPSEQDAKRWPHLEDIKLPSISEKDVRLIVGTNAPEAFWVLEERRGNRGEPYAIRTPLGWTLMGPMGGTDCRDRDLNVNFVHLVESARKDEDCLMQQVERFWAIESYGLASDSNVCMSVEDKRALAIMERSVKLDQGHYQVALPWRQYPPFLPYNRPMAERRLQALKRRLLQDEKLFESYKTTIEEYIAKGHARRVPFNEVHVDDKRPLWYLPHHPVLNKPGKTRIVFDCAAKYGGTSLNDQLLTGPDLTNSIVGVLMRFREERVALSADIECMFHQVGVPPDDQDAFRFLWWPDGNLNQQPVEHRMEVHLFGATSSPSCCNFALKRTAEDNKGEFPEEVVRTVKRNFYVDDCLKSVKSAKDAVEFMHQLRSILSKGGFRLTKWLSNSSEVLDCIPLVERAPSILSLDLDKEDPPVQRTLGLKWDLEKDEFTFKVTLKDKPNTRRGILSMTSSVYDPLGLVAPVVLTAKKLLQDLCRRKIGWDDPISDEDGEKWEKWKSQLPSLSRISLRRCIKPVYFGGLKSAELHNFADASQIAYGAVSYVRMVDDEDRIHCTFLIGKSRLAHLKPMTVPRLELSAAVLAVQLDKSVRKELDIPITQSTYWTDSTCVLQYIRNQSKRFHTFVANRLSVIHENSAPHQWRHVSSELNPADEVSRGLTVEEMCANNRWLNGPQFLTKKDEFWPRDPTLHEPELSDDDPEIKRDAQSNSQSSPRHQGENILSSLIERHSSWERLKRAVAWLHRFKTWFIERYSRSLVNSKVKSTANRGILSVHEMKEAEREIIKHTQRISFPEVIQALQRTGSLQHLRQATSELKNLKITNHMRKLHPLLDEMGILRVGGRLENALIDYDAKHPVILPYRDHVTDIIISQHHQKTGHLGQEYVLSSLRHQYWVIKGRSAVRRILSGCFLCKKLGAVRGEQLMGDLPKERLSSEEPPFTHVGVDYFGPLYVRQGRSNVKRYGCLFTCLAVRAVHIEVVHSLDTDGFINALRRFVSLRGCPTTIHSDNGTNFRAGEKELRESLSKWNQTTIQVFLRQKNIIWKFNPPGASHMGGAWERIIRSIRKILRALLGQQLVSDEMLQTLMAEVTGILNSRPLTPVSSDPKDLEPLTPNHLLLLRANPNLPVGSFGKEDGYSKRRWRQVQYMSDIFWKRWLKEYLPTLQERAKWMKPRRSLKIGDLVLIADENVHRGKWPLGRVVDVFRGKDGYVRSAKVRTSLTVLTRPVTKLCFLEGQRAEH